MVSIGLSNQWFTLKEGGHRVGKQFVLLSSPEDDRLRKAGRIAVQLYVQTGRGDHMPGAVVEDDRRYSLEKEDEEFH